MRRSDTRLRRLPFAVEAPEWTEWPHCDFRPTWSPLPKDSIRPSGTIYISSSSYKRHKEKKQKRPLVSVVKPYENHTLTLPQDGVGTSSDTGAHQFGGLAFNGNRADRIDLRRRWRHQNRNIKELAVQFDARTAFLEPALELAIVSVVGGAGDPQIVQTFVRLESDPVKLERGGWTRGQRKKLERKKNVNLTNTQVRPSSSSFTWWNISSTNQ